MTDYFHDLDVFVSGSSLLIEPSFDSPPKDRLVGDQEVKASGGTEEIVEISEDVVWAGQYSKMLCSFAEQAEFARHMFLSMGRLRSFWFPSFVSDFTLYQDTSGAASHYLYVIPNNFDWVFQPNRYGLFIRTANGDRHLWEIENYLTKEQSPFDILVTKSQLGQTIKKRDVQYASIVRFVRFDSDKFKFVMDTPDAGTVSYQFLELPHEALFAKKLNLVDDLSVGYDYEASFSSQVMMGAAWWDAASDQSDNSGGDLRRWRTNSRGAVVEVETELGTRALGINPDDLPYDRLNYHGRAFDPRQPIWAYRSRPVNLLGQFTAGWSDWQVSNVSHHPDYEEGYWVVTDLDPDQRVRLQIRVAEAEDFGNSDSRTCRFFEPGQGSLTNPVTSEAWPSEEITHSIMWQLSGFVVNNAGGLRSFSDLRQKLKVLVLGDTDLSRVLHTDSDGQASYFNPDRDRRGTSICWPQLLADHYEEDESGVRVSLLDAGHSQTVFMAQTDKMRAGTTPSGLPPTLTGMSDLVGKFSKHTNTRDISSGWVPDIVIFGYTVTDQLIASLVNDQYSSGDAQADANAIWSAVHSKWPSCHIIVVPFPRLDSALSANPWTGDSISVRSELIDSVTVDHSSDGWIEHISIDALGTGSGRGTILTRAEHAQAESIIYPDFNAAADAALGL